jgi:hypothetical protein
MPPRTVAVIGAVCLTTGWLLASLLTPPVARVQSLPERRQTPTPAEAQQLAPYSEQLHLKLRQAPIAPTPRRNPFAFGTQERVSETRATATEPPRDAPITTPAPPVGPIYSLAGIGVKKTPEGAMHTAVLSDGRAVHLVKAGDVIGGYKVIEVTESSVTLAEPSGVQHVLRLSH